MEIYDGFETVKQKLIIAGMQEIENHGITDFSLRRVASACNVSCAAPYKHFKDKEHFIIEITNYIHKQWSSLAKQVLSIFEDAPLKELTEICVAYIKFWIANPRFRSVLMLSSDSLGEEYREILSAHSDYTAKIIESCLEKLGFKDDVLKQKEYIIRSMLYGTTHMFDTAELENGEETIKMIKDSLRMIVTQ